uniref:Putative secreted protein n=1 Tax=Ixodes scapularis TaxID=6945 RepID=A0A4D5RBW7_IXOSC
MSMPWGFLQVAGILGPSDGSPGPLPQVHHHPAGGGHSVPGHGHQPAGGRGLGHDAVVLRPPLYAGAGEAGEVRRAPAVLRRGAAHRLAQAGRQLHLPPGAERPQASPHLGGHSPQHPRGRSGGHHEQRLPRLRHQHRPAVRRQRQPRHQRHHLSLVSARPRRRSARDVSRTGVCTAVESDPF